MAGPTNPAARLSAHNPECGRQAVGVFGPLVRPWHRWQPWSRKFAASATWANLPRRAADFVPSGCHAARHGPAPSARWHGTRSFLPLVPFDSGRSSRFCFDGHDVSLAHVIGRKCRQPAVAEPGHLFGCQGRLQPFESRQTSIVHRDTWMPVEPWLPSSIIHSRE